MADLASNSARVLCEEILAQARRQAEEIVVRAQQEAKTLIDKATTESKDFRDQRLHFVQTEALRRKNLILVTVSIEKARLDAARREVLLDSIREEVQRRIVAREGFDYLESLVVLVIEAITRLPGDAFVIKVSSRDSSSLSAELRDQVKRRVGRSVNITILEDPVIAEGVMIEGVDGYQVWDNRLSERLKRFWPELRQRVALASGLLATGEKK